MPNLSSYYCSTFTGQPVVEASLNKAVKPIGLLQEPKWTTAKAYLATVIEYAEDAMPKFIKAGAKEFRFNGEHCQDPATAALAMQVLLKMNKNVKGMYGHFVDDMGAAFEPKTDKLARNRAMLAALAPFARVVSICGYARMARGGSIEAENGAVYPPVVRRVHHAIQQVRMFDPKAKIEVYVCSQAEDNDTGSPVTDVPEDQFKKIVDGIAALPGAPDMLHFSEYDDKNASGLPLTPSRLKCREHFAAATSK